MTAEQGKEEAAMDAKVEKTTEVIDSKEKSSEEVALVSNGKDIPETKASDDNNVSDLDESIIRQIEYYFGDVNMPRDKFLQDQIQLDDGWVPFTIMFNFKRLSNLTKDPEVVIAALAKSESQLMEVSEDKTKIRRSPNYPLPELNEERRKELMSRTVYVKGFPKDTTTLDICLNFFKKYSYPDNIILRRYSDKTTKQWIFKGSVFVTFKTVQEAENFLNESSVKFEGQELIKKWQKKYLEEKRLEFEERTKSKEANKRKQAKKEEQQKPNFTLPSGTVLILSDVPEKITRNEIKDAVTALGANVGFVKIEEGKAWVRLQTENSAKELFEKCTDSKMKIEDVELVCSLLEGDEERKFLDEMASEMVQKRHKQCKNKGGGGKQYNRKRKGGSDSGPHKKRNK